MKFIVFFGICILGISSIALKKRIRKKKENAKLLFVFEHCRHGSRSPGTENQTENGKYVDVLNQEWDSEERDLTQFGESQHYFLGKFLKEQYNSLGLNKTNILVTSTHKNRTQMSIIAQLYGLFGKKQLSLKDLNYMVYARKKVKENDRKLINNDSKILDSKKIVSRFNEEIPEVHIIAKDNQFFQFPESEVCKGYFNKIQKNNLFYKKEVKDHVIKLAEKYLEKYYEYKNEYPKDSVDPFASVDSLDTLWKLYKTLKRLNISYLDSVDFLWKFYKTLKRLNGVSFDSLDSFDFLWKLYKALKRLNGARKCGKINDLKTDIHPIAENTTQFDEDFDKFDKYIITEIKSNDTSHQFGDFGFGIVAKEVIKYMEKAIKEDQGIKEDQDEIKAIKMFILSGHAETVTVEEDFMKLHFEKEIQEVPFASTLNFELEKIGNKYNVKYVMYEPIKGKDVTKKVEYKVKFAENIPYDEFNKTISEIKIDFNKINEACIPYRSNSTKKTEKEEEEEDDDMEYF